MSRTRGRSERNAAAVDDAAASNGPQRDSGGTPWLSGHKVEIPDPVADYVERTALEDRCSAMAGRITLLQAPGGFGKTALLAHCCRRLRGQGVAVAWLSLDEDDGPEALAGHLALAFAKAGIDSAGVHDEGGVEEPGEADGDTQAEYRIKRVTRAIERAAVPCVLALDEVERLHGSATFAALNRFVRAAPRGLHLAVACREIPAGLDLAALVLDGESRAITTEDLRFSRADVARFFESKLTRREITAVTENSAGWPIALRICRNSRGLEAGAETLDADDAAAVWIESRLWRGVSAADRDLVLDIALFDGIDADLVEEATGVLNVRRRLESMGALAGLLQKSGGARSPTRLHPLVRDHCASRRFIEDAARFRSIHRAAARALGRRGRVVDALRHAAEAADAALIGEIAIDAGGIQLWVRSGFGVLRAVNGYLTADVVAAQPRLALVRCLVLGISGEVGRGESHLRRDWRLDAGQRTRASRSTTCSCGECSA